MIRLLLFVFCDLHIKLNKCRLINIPKTDIVWAALTASRLSIVAIFCRPVVVVFVVLLCRRVAESPSRGACRLQLFTPFRWLIATVLLFNVLFRLFFRLAAVAWPGTKVETQTKAEALSVGLAVARSSQLAARRPAMCPSFSSSSRFGSSSGCGSSVFIYVFHLFNSKRRLPGQLCRLLCRCVFSSRRICIFCSRRPCKPFPFPIPILLYRTEESPGFVCFGSGVFLH